MLYTYLCENAPWHVLFQLCRWHAACLGSSSINTNVFSSNISLISISSISLLCVVTVMNDIITTMFNKKFLEELFKPQELYSKKALRTVFDRLAHASIMRLNQASMDKVTSYSNQACCPSKSSQAYTHIQWGEINVPSGLWCSV